MIIIEIITLVASIGTCVFAYLVWKSGFVSNASPRAIQEKPEPKTKRSEQLSTLVSGMSTKASSVLTHRKASSKTESKEVEHLELETLVEKQSVVINDNEQPVFAEEQKNNDTQNDLESVKDDIQSKDDDLSLIASTSKGFVGYSREIKVEDSKNATVKTLDNLIFGRHASMKLFFLIGAIIFFLTSVVFGFLFNWIVMALSLLASSVCVAGYTTKRNKYVRVRAIKQEAIDEFALLKDRVILLNENEGLSEEEKDMLVERWIILATEKIKESQQVIKSDAFKVGITAGIVSLVVVGLISMLPFIIRNIKDSVSLNNLGESNNAESSVIEESVTEETTTTVSTESAISIPTPTSTPTPVVVSNPIDICYLVTDITASSIDNESSGNNYYPYQIMDGDLNTSWAEGVDGNGIGEYISFSIPEGTLISGLIIYTGYCKSSSVFYNNGAPSKLDVYSGDVGYSLNLNTAETHYAPENYEVAIEGIYVSFPSAIVSNGELRITIVDVRDGDSWDDTNISEIIIMGAASSEGITYSAGAGIPSIDETDYEETTTNTSTTTYAAEEEWDDYEENIKDDWYNDFARSGRTVTFITTDYQATTTLELAYGQTAHSGIAYLTYEYDSGTQEDIYCEGSFTESDMQGHAYFDTGSFDYYVEYEDGGFVLYANGGAVKFYEESYYYDW